MSGGHYSGRSAAQTEVLQKTLDALAIEVRERIAAAGFKPVVTEIVLYEGFMDPVLRTTDIHPDYERLATTGKHPSRWKKGA